MRTDSSLYGRWYSSPFVELVWILRTTALLSQQGKQRTRSQSRVVGVTCFGLSSRWLGPLRQGGPAIAQGSTLVTGRLVCATKQCMPRGTHPAQGALQQRAGQYEGL